MLLIGGLKAWKETIGDEGVLKRMSPNSSAGSLSTTGHTVPSNLTGSSTSGTSTSEEETFLYDRSPEAKYPPNEKLQPQHTGSDYSTETPASSKLLGKRFLSPLSAAPHRPVNGSVSEMI